MFFDRPWLSASLALLACFIAGASEAIGIGSALCLAFFSLGFSSYGARARIFQRPRRVRIDGGILWVGDRVLGRAASYGVRVVHEIPNGLGVGSSRPGTRVEVLDDEQRPVFQMEAMNHADAQAFIAALGAHRGAGEFQGTGRVFGSLWAIAGLLLATALPGLASLTGTIFDIGTWFAALLVPVCIAVWTFGTAALRVRVGADGVALRRLGRRTFVPFSEVSEVVPTKRGAILVRAAKPPITVDIAGIGEVQRSPEVHEFQRFLAYALERWSGLGRSGASALLAQNGRSDDAWRRDLDALRRGDGYREAGLTDDVLWGVVEDASADATAREGAAHLLRARLDATGRARLRECIRITAAPKLRLALEQCAAVHESIEGRAVARLSYA